MIGLSCDTNCDIFCAPVALHEMRNHPMAKKNSKNSKKSKKSKKSKPALAKMFYRWPQDWRDAADDLKDDDETMVQFLLSILRPILEGKVKLVRDENRRVIEYKTRPRRIARLSEPQTGIGRKPDNARAAEMYAHFKRSKSIAETAQHFGCVPSNVRRIFTRCEYDF